MNNKQVILGSALLCGALTVLSAAPASATTINLYGKFTTSVSNVTSGDKPPTVTDQYLWGGDGNSSHPYFYVNGLTATGTPGAMGKYATGKPGTSGANQTQTGNGNLLFSVNPASCIHTNNKNCKSGTEYATIGVTFTLWDGLGNMATISDTALAKFVYNNETDNLCWNNSTVSVGGNATLVKSKAVGTCLPPGAGTPNNLPTGYGFEEIIFKMGSNYFEINLYNWNDWNETPSITFAMLDPKKVPEPASVTLLGAGLLGLRRLIRRRKKTA
jgi:hypothetical protein